MKCAEPPRVAAWMLEHLLPDSVDEALVGDLFEEFRSGRSARWFWRQVLAAIGIVAHQEIASRRTVLIFALLWSAIAPIWMYIARPSNFPGIIESVRHIDWPWSSLCTIGLRLVPILAFVWTGVLVYLLLASRTKMRTKLRIDLQGVQIGLVRSLASFLPFWIGTCAVTSLLRSVSLHFANGQTLFPAIENLSARLPFFATILWALWGETPIKSRSGAPVS